MSNILLITSSPRGAASHSTAVGKALADRLASARPGSIVTVRDLAAAPPAHIGEDFVGAIFAPNADGLTGEQRDLLAQSDNAVAELFAADTIVIASAMVNFSLTTTLKAWFDNVLRAGKTFRYTANGPEGLVTGKKAYLALARGGFYSEGPMKAFDFQEPYLRTLLGFIGITDVETIAVEGVALGPEQAEKGKAAALAKVAGVSVPSLAA